MLEKAGRFHEQVEGPGQWFVVLRSFGQLEELTCWFIDVDTFGKYDARDGGSKENRRPPTGTGATTSSRIQVRCFFVV